MESGSPMDLSLLKLGGEFCFGRFYFERFLFWGFYFSGGFILKALHKHLEISGKCGRNWTVPAYSAGKMLSFCSGLASRAEFWWNRGRDGEGWGEELEKASQEYLCLTCTSSGQLLENPFNASKQEGRKTRLFHHCFTFEISLFPNKQLEKQRLQCSDNSTPEWI